MKSTLILRNVLVAAAHSTATSQSIRGLQSNGPQTRIIGGSDANRIKYPYAQVSLQDWLGNHQCGGSVVAPNVIMTAGHCADYLYMAVVGVYDLSDTSENVERFQIVEKLIHPEYQDSDQVFDVLLLSIDGNITITNAVIINENATLPQFGENLTVVGWGATSIAGNYPVYPDIMQEVEVSYVENPKCNEMLDESDFGMLFSAYEDMMCAVGEGKDSCYGDSGGPLLLLGDDLADTVQVGITSWGFGCGSGTPGVYHRTSSSFPWIRKNICKMSNTPPDYLSCNTESPTASPSEAPSQAPTVAASATPSQQLSSSSAATLGEARAQASIAVFALFAILI